MISVDDAVARILELVEPVGVETVSVRDAVGRVLRADVLAARTQPPFPASAMDGYAVRAVDATEGAVLAVVAELAAGAPAPHALRPGEAMRIFTGAPVPDEADAILLQENARPLADGRVEVLTAPTPDEWIRPAGGDFREGDLLLRAPRRLSAADVALAAAMGRAWLTVARRPRVAVMPLGDELVWPGDEIPPGHIVSSNNFGVAALLDQFGAEPTLFPIVRDDLDATRAAIQSAAGFDAIVTLGGASDGDHDLSRPAFAAEGMSPDFYKIAMRPGKPLMAGRLGRAVVLGLPGNPVSAMVCALLFVRPALTALTGRAPRPPRADAVRLAAPLSQNGPRAHYMRAVWSTNDAGERTVMPADSQDSSLLSRLSAADCLLVRPPHDAPRAVGELVDCIDLATGFSS